MLISTFQEVGGSRRLSGTGGGQLWVARAIPSPTLEEKNSFPGWSGTVF